MHGFMLSYIDMPLYINMYTQYSYTYIYDIYIINTVEQVYYDIV